MGYREQLGVSVLGAETADAGPGGRVKTGWFLAWQPPPAAAFPPTPTLVPLPLAAVPGGHLTLTRANSPPDFQPWTRLVFHRDPALKVGWEKGAPWQRWPATGERTAGASVPESPSRDEA